MPGAGAIASSAPRQTGSTAPPTMTSSPRDEHALVVEALALDQGAVRRAGVADADALHGGAGGAAGGGRLGVGNRAVARGRLVLAHELALDGAVLPRRAGRRQHEVGLRRPADDERSRAGQLDDLAGPDAAGERDGPAGHGPDARARGAGDA